MPVGVRVDQEMVRVYYIDFLHPAVGVKTGENQVHAQVCEDNNHKRGMPGSRI